MSGYNCVVMVAHTALGALLIPEPKEPRGAALGVNLKGSNFTN
jgi:hypothetical protein